MRSTLTAAALLLLSSPALAFDNNFLQQYQQYNAQMWNMPMNMPPGQMPIIMPPIPNFNANSNRTIYTTCQPVPYTNQVNCTSR